MRPLGGHGPSPHRRRGLARQPHQRILDQGSTRTPLPPGHQEEHLGTLGSMAERLEVLPDRVLMYVDDADASTRELYSMGLHPVSQVSRRPR